ncbi:anti sigma factor C-terminal domain-containing protein [Clostridium sp. DL1XJH146]
MSFKELLEKYKEGTLNEEEKQYVESEIEKNESINEFLADEIDLGIELNNKDKENSEIDNKKIKEVMNKKFRKITIISIVSVFIILLGAKYIVSPIVDSFYYNPSKVSVGECFQDIQFDMSVYVELYRPGYTFGYAYAEPLGFGKYNIAISQNDLFEENNVDTNISLIRNRKIGNFNNLLDNELNDGDFFYRNLGNEIEEFSNIQSEEAIAHLKEVPSTSYVSAYVDFKEDLTMEELVALENEYKDSQDNTKSIDFKWVAIRVIDSELISTESEGETIDARRVIVDKVGFNPNSVIDTTDSADKEKYPYLSLLDYYTATKPFEDWNKALGYGYEVHFNSLLQYLYDRKEFTTSLDKRPVQGDFYANSLDYIKENGVKTYGVLVYGEAKDIISFMERDETNCIYISDIKVSKYSK